MARPRYDNPEMFSAGEISAGTGLSLRNVQLLRDRGLGPQAVEQNEGRKGANVYGLEAMMEFALINGFHLAGVPLLAAARLPDAVWSTTSDGRLNYMARIERMAEGRGKDFWPHCMPEDGDFGFWLHHELRTQPGSPYVPGKAQKWDLIVIIADKRHVLRDMLTPPKIGGAEAIGVFSDDWTDGEGFVPEYERRTNMSPEAVNQEYRDAALNAVGLLRVNISLAIRQVLDRIHDARMERGGPHFGGLYA